MLPNFGNHPKNSNGFNSRGSSNFKRNSNAKQLSSNRSSAHYNHFIKPIKIINDNSTKKNNSKDNSNKKLVSSNQFDRASKKYPPTPKTQVSTPNQPIRTNSKSNSKDKTPPPNRSSCRSEKKKLTNDTREKLMNVNPIKNFTPTKKDTLIPQNELDVNAFLSLLNKKAASGTTMNINDVFNLDQSNLSATKEKTNSSGEEENESGEEEIEGEEGNDENDAVYQEEIKEENEEEEEKEEDKKDKMTPEERKEAEQKKLEYSKLFYEYYAKLKNLGSNFDVEAFMNYYKQIEEKETDSDKLADFVEKYIMEKIPNKAQEFIEIFYYCKVYEGRYRNIVERLKAAQ